MADVLQGPIRAVLFDVDGTLYWQPPVRLAMTCEMAVAGGVRALTQRRRPHDARLVLTFRNVREKLRATGDGEPLERRQYSAVSARLGCSPDHVEQVVSEWIYRRPLKWLRFCRRRGLARFLQFLTERSVRRGVFSDYPAHDKLSALGIAGSFDLELSAVDREIGAFKPDPSGFRAASERWGLPAEQILYVGDRLDVDVPGAAAAGMRCALIGSHRRGGMDFIPVNDFKELQRVLDPIC